MSDFNSKHSAAQIEAKLDSIKNMTGATGSAAGQPGFVPAPPAGAQGKYLKGDGTWAVINNMTAATASAAGQSGFVPAPPAGAQGKYLKGDGTWGAINNMTAATASAAGQGGLVPVPPAGAQVKFLRGDGTWQTTPNTTYSVATESANGLMSSADKKTVNRFTGVNTVTTLASLPVTKRSITATLSAATTLSVASGMQIGEELMIRCVPTAAFTQTIPNTGDYVSMSGTSITTTANKPFEINIWCYASGKYSIAVKEQD